MLRPPLPANESQRLAALYRRAILDTPTEARFDRLTRIAQRTFDTRMALVSLIDAERQWFKSRQGLDVCETGRDVSFCGHAILGKDILQISDATQDPRFADNPLVTGAPHIRFYAGAPLFTSEGYCLGTLCIIDDRPRQLDAVELEMLREFADCVEAEINRFSEEESKRELNQFKATLDQTLDCVFMFDARTLHFIYANEGALRQIGYDSSELLNMHPYDIKPDISEAQFRRRIAPLLSGEQASLTFETVHGHKNGQRIPVDIFLQYVAPRGEAPRFVVIARDISERRKAEEALRISEERRKIATDSGRVAVWEVDLSTRGLTWDDNSFALYQLPKEQFAGEFSDWADRLHLDDLSSTLAVFEQAVTGLKHYQAEFRIVWPDGQIRHLQAHGRVITDTTGKPERMIGTNWDITEQKRIEQTLIAARNEAERANQAKSEFLSSMSHELRTPLNAILGFGQLMEFEESLSESSRDGLSEILKAGAHLLELINDMLNLARIEAGQLELSPGAVDVGVVVGECMALTRSLAHQRSVGLEYGGAQGLMVRADGKRFKQALLNLISNAIKYNRDGGSVRIEVRSEAEEWVRVSVRDTGIGIPANRMDELFLPFNRLGAEGGTVEGTGIGLTITRRLVEMMDGSVQVESEPGVGSTFWIDLPREVSVHAVANGA